MNKNAEERVQKLFAGMRLSLKETDPEFVEIISNFSQDETVGVSKLTEKEQMLCILSVLLGCQGMGEFQNMLHAALNMGIAWGGTAPLKPGDNRRKDAVSGRTGKAGQPVRPGYGKAADGRPHPAQKYQPLVGG